MFAVITPALISGAIADRMKFWSWTLFVAPLGRRSCYFPVAHWVFSFDGFVGADAIGGWIANSQARRARLRRWHRGPHQRRCRGSRAGARARQAPWLAQGADAAAQPALRAAGRGLLWFGWFGFNAGSALTAGDLAAVAFINTMVATAAAVLGWLIVEQIRDGKPTTLGAASGAVAGLVAITPAAGYVSPLGGIAIGFIAGVRLRTRGGAEVPLRLRRLARRRRCPPRRRPRRHPAHRLLRHRLGQLAGRQRPVLRRRFAQLGKQADRGVRRDGLLVRRHHDPRPASSSTRSASGSPRRPRSPASTRPSTPRPRTTSRPSR